MAEDWKSRFEWRIENLKGTITLADSTIRSLILTNGAAGAGLLTFLGNSKGTSSNGFFIAALGCFGVGVFLAVVCSLLAYIAQRSVATLEDNKVEMPFAWSALALAGISAAFFAFGLILGAMGLKTGGDPNGGAKMANELAPIISAVLGALGTVFLFLGTWGLEPYGVGALGGPDTIRYMHEIDRRNARRKLMSRIGLGFLMASFITQGLSAVWPIQ